MRNRSKHAPPNLRHAAATQMQPGCLITLIGPEEHGRDLLIETARRRFANDADLVFPVLLTTRPQVPASGHLHVSRRIFRELLADGGFSSTWTCSGHDFALGAEAEQSLRAGRTVVVPVPGSAAPRVLSKWPRSTVVEIGARPHRSRRGTDFEKLSTGGYHAIFHAGDLAVAVARFRALLEQLRPANSNTPRETDCAPRMPELSAAQQPANDQHNYNKS